MSEQVLLSTKGLLPGFKLYKEGKVRDVYIVGDRLLIIATDRISAFDVVLPNGIPYKGKVLNTLSAFWFHRTRSVCENHMLTADVSEYPPELQPYAELLEGRSMLVRRAKRIDFECVVRGYIAGFAWRAYNDNGIICGIQLPDGLRESDKLAEPIFTPSTKIELKDGGHDENISLGRMIRLIRETMGRNELQYSDLPEMLVAFMRSKSLAMYELAASLLLGRGLILADTKFEFGICSGQPMFIDEVFTPDSSRFWPLDDYKPGRSQESFDKQYARDHLDELDWDKTPPAPELPPDIVRRTSEKYREALWRITGQKLA